MVSRAANVNGTATALTNALTAGVLASAATSIVPVTNGAAFAIGDVVAFELIAGQGADLATHYVVTAITLNDLTLDRNVVHDIPVGSESFSIQQVMNSVFESISVGGVPTPVASYAVNMRTIGNHTDFLTALPSIAMSGADAKAKFIARNPGAWGNNIEIAIATPSAFNTATPSEAFVGIPLEGLFEYFPTGTEVGIVVRDGINIVETWTVDFNPLGKDQNNKSTYIEDVINNQSSYIFVKDNTANTTASADYLASVNGVAGSTLTMILGTDSPIQADDLLNAYDLWTNVELMDIDIVIANELDNGASAVSLVNTRKDCICFIGANYADCVGHKATVAVSNLINWRKTGAINYNNMFVVACGNYMYQYDRYNDKYRWINCAGSIAGLNLLSPLT